MILAVSAAGATVYGWDANGAEPPTGSFWDTSCWQPDGSPGNDDEVRFALDKTYSVMFSGYSDVASTAVVKGVVTLQAVPHAVPAPEYTSSLLWVLDGKLIVPELTLRTTSLHVEGPDDDEYGAELVVGAKGIVTSNSATIGKDTTSSFVTIQGGSWTNHGFMFIGGSYSYDPGAQVTVTAEGRLENKGTLYIGMPGMQGGISVEDAGTRLVAEDVVIGTEGFGDGSLTVSNGGYVWMNDCFLGYNNADGGGLFRVDGVDSACNVRSVQMGGKGLSHLVIDNNAELRIRGDLHVVAPWTEDGLAILDLRYGLLAADGFYIEMPNAGRISPRIYQNMSFRVNTMTDFGDKSFRRLEVGHSGALTSQVQMTSNWRLSEDLVVGLDARGVMTIGGGGSVTSSYGRIGREYGAVGNLTVTTNARWDNANHVYVGDWGQGNLTIANGGVVTDTYGYIGEEYGSQGSVTVSGLNAHWNNASHLYIADKGAGSLLISDRGTVSNVFGYVGHQAGASGTVTLDGIGSTWNNTYVFVGDHPASPGGSGTVTVNNGATLNASVGVEVGTDGRVNLPGGSIRTGDLRFYGNAVFSSGAAGELFVNYLVWSAANSGVLDLGACAVNTGHGGTLSQIAVGAGQTLTVGGPLEVGYDGNATLTVSDGGYFRHTHNGYGRIANRAAAQGVVNVRGAGSRWTSTNSLEVGQNGTLNVETGAAAEIGNVLFINGKINLTGGELKAYNAQMRALRANETPADLLNFTGGTLAAALFQGDVVNNGGTIAVAHNGSSTITGDLTINAGSTRIRIGGRTRHTQYDAVRIDGDATWGGTLEVVLTNGFVLGVGDTFDVLDFDRTRQRHWFEEISLPGLPGGLRWDVKDLYITGTIKIGSGVILAWGHDTSGQLNVPNAANFSAVAAGGTFGIALHDQGKIMQWGFNPYGSPPTAVGFVDIAAAGYHGLAVHQDGHLAGWGSNFYGESNVPAGNNFAAVAAGFNHSLALRKDGSLAAWGLLPYGIAPPTGTGYKAIAAGYAFSAAVRADGSIVAWGDSANNLLNVPAGNDFVAIAAGYYHGIALRTGGTIAVWGATAYGLQSDIPAGVFVEIAAGATHNLAKKTDGTIVAWGTNAYGELNVPPGNDIVTIAGGDGFSLAVAAQRPMPRILAPVTGGIVTAGAPYEVRWTNWQKIDDMLLYYRVSNSTPFASMVPQNHGNTGSYMWQVPQVVSNECSLKIRDARDPGLQAVVGPFRIRMPIYVDNNAAGWNDGTSWFDAFTNLQDAISAAEPGDSIWVAASSRAYRPDQGAAVAAGDVNATFNMQGLRIYGGFPSGGGAWRDRDPAANRTILSGDLAANDGANYANYADNSYHILTCRDADASTVLDGFTITAANSNTSGGGILNTNGSPRIANCAFVLNRAADSGAGMHTLNGSPTLENCTFTGNWANNAAGGLNLNGGAPVVTNCVFEGNYGNWAAGGLYIIKSSPTVTNCTFRDNWSSHWGGALHNTQPETLSVIDGCWFEGNYAPDGGAIYNRVNSSPTLHNCVFADNRATGGLGGAIYNSSSRPTMANCVFVGNSSADDCGGVFLYNASIAVFKNCAFSGNTSPDKAGAIYTRTNSSATVTGCTFSANAAGYGGGLYAWESSSFTVANSIFWGNTAATGPQIRIENNSSLSITYTDVQGGLASVMDATSVMVAGAGNIANDPAFADADGADNLAGTIDDDLHLTASSLCINRGSPAYAPAAGETDIDGAARIVGGRVDLGADEFLYAGDLNVDGSVDVDDLNVAADCWSAVACETAECIQAAGCEASDVDGDGQITLHDFAVLAANWLRDLPL
jgi:T5SS/PEP-CTERM-associated repeat protein